MSTRPLQLLRRGVLATALLAALAAVPGQLRAEPTAETAQSRAAGALKRKVEAELAAYLAARRTAEGITAVSAFVDQGPGRPSFSAVTGRMGRTDPTPIHDRTLFEIGSNTKSFTAALLLKEEAAGRLDIDQTLARWLPQFPAWGKESIRRMLHMTARIPTYSEAPDFQRIQAAQRFRHFTLKELVAFAYPSKTVKLPVPTEPWFYSNTDYILAGMIAVKSAGYGYARQLRARIFQPLGMGDTFYFTGGLPQHVIRRMASGYFLNPECGLYRPNCRRTALAPLFGKDLRDADLTWTGPAGGIVSTPRDLAKWVRGLFGGKVIPPAQLKKMLTLVSTETGKPLKVPTKADPRGFGLGLAYMLVPGLPDPFWFYEGETLGYRAVFAYFPVDDLVLTVFTNSQPAGDEDQIGALVAEIYHTVMDAR